MTYADKLKAPRWQRKRLEILQRDDFTCKNCGDSDKTLHVHHKYYIPKKQIWAYDDYAYQTLCEDCHRIITEQDSSITTLLFNDLDDTIAKQYFIEVLTHCDFKILADRLYHAIGGSSLEDVINALNDLMFKEV